MSFLDNIFSQQSSGGGGLSSTSESDISESRGFLATIASAVTSSRMAVDLTTAVTGYLQTLAGAVTAARVAVNLDATSSANLATLAGAIATGNMKAILQAGTAVIGKLAANVGVNIGTVDVASLPAGTQAVPLRVDPTGTTNQPVSLPAHVGQRTRAGSLSVTMASDESPIPVGDGGASLTVDGAVSVTSMPTLTQLPLAVGQQNKLNSLSVVFASDAPTQAVTISSGLPAGTNNIGDVDVLSMPSLPAGTNAIGKLAANIGINIGTVDVLSLPTVPTANLNTIAADTTFLRSYNPSLPAGTNNIGKVDVLQLPPALGSTLKTGSLSVALASDHGAISVQATGSGMSLGPGTNSIGAVTSVQLPQNLGQVSMAGSLSVTMASNQAAIPVSLQTTAQLPTSLGLKSSATSLPVVVATDGQAVPVVVSPLPAGSNNIGVVSLDATAIAKLDSIIAGQGAPAALYGGRTTVATAGTRVVLGTSQALTEGVELRGLDTNLGLVYPGSSTVTSTTNGTRLGAKERVFIRCSNVNKVYIDAATSGEGVSWIGW